MSRSDPPYLPIGVRAALRMTTSRVDTNTHCMSTPLEDVPLRLHRTGEAGAWQQQSETGAGVARHELELAAMRRRDAERHRQAEAGAAHLRLGGHERLEDSGRDVGRNAGPIVADLERRVA